MTDIEIDKALALAVGWERILPTPEANRLQECWVWTGHAWRVFSHRDWNVIGPIAERYDCFPVKAVGGWYSSNWFEDKEVAQMYATYAGAPQRAIALAVIQGAKK